MPLSDIPTVFKHLARRLFTAFPMAKPISLQGKIAIVTGASPGSIGYETAKTLASWGCTVIVTTRSNTQSCVHTMVAELKNKHLPHAISGHSLNLTQAESVDAFVQWYQATFGNALNILINNAGVHADILSSWTEPQLTDDGFEIHWRTNFLGPLHLTHRLLPLLGNSAQKNNPARVVFVASHLHQRGENSELFERNMPYNSWQAYGQSKLALVHSAFELQRRYANSQKIQSYVLHPGSIATNIAHKGLEGNQWLQKLLALANPLQSIFLLTPQQGAQTQIHCATSPHLHGGQYFDRCEPAQPSPQTQDLHTAKKLWDKTEQWIESLAQDQPTPVSSKTRAIS